MKPYSERAMIKVVSQTLLRRESIAFRMFCQNSVDPSSQSLIFYGVLQRGIPTIEWNRPNLIAESKVLLPTISRLHSCLYHALPASMSNPNNYTIDWICPY